MAPDRETIAAIATPKGTGGIAVIRVSGSKAISASNRIFRGKTSLEAAESGRLYLGQITQGEKGRSSLVDEVMVSVFRAPRSYTREDVVEISCHGGEYVSRRILEVLLLQGIRVALPGEFTERAFLNGRLDLSQAEAVHDIINAKTRRSLESALCQFEGVLSGKVSEIREQLIGVCSLLELELDFAEEDVQFANRDEVGRRLASIIADISSFEKTYERGRIYRDGARLVLTGKPNVGKSSLMNALLKSERAIVTSIPGTTRDTIEEQLDISGVLFRVVDTAGVRTASDEVEKIGVQRSLKQIEMADIVIFIIDGSERLGPQDFQLLDEVERIRGNSFGSTVILAINKSDLPIGLSKEELQKFAGSNQVQRISAKEMTGFSSLEEKLLSIVEPPGRFTGESAMVTNLRHREALLSARADLESAEDSLKQGLSSELLAVDLRGALHHLGEIIGEIDTEDILSAIFSKFCIGK